MDVTELHGTIGLEHDLFDTVFDRTRLCSRPLFLRDLSRLDSIGFMLALLHPRSLSLRCWWAHDATEVLLQRREPLLPELDIVQDGGYHCCPLLECVKLCFHLADPPVPIISDYLKHVETLTDLALFSTDLLSSAFSTRSLVLR
jgi:hypothetical protein